MNRNKSKTISNGKHGEFVKKTLYRCISEGLMHVAAWYHGTPDQSSRNSGNKFPLAIAVKFRCAPTKMCDISLEEEFCSPEKLAKVHPKSPDLSPIDMPYTSFYRHSVVTLALDCFVSETSLVLYRKCHFCPYPLVFHPKLETFPELDQ